MASEATPVEQSMKKGSASLARRLNQRASVEEVVLEQQVLMCKAFANATRLHILELLGRRNWIAGELQKELGISKANLSQHITVLKTAGVIVRRREGKRVYFVLAMPEVKQACQLIRSMLRTRIQKGGRFFM
ncbi:MAG: metalloregulator ArsR/SmtB family transcription factor [Acidobacteriia bacterium]|nr:metalloregulator ArsR/SmtB family transcription factor [Terriglobia bacterium]